MFAALASTSARSLRTGTGSVRPGACARKRRRRAPDAGCSDRHCLRVNRPRALAIVAGELARANDATPNNLRRPPPQRQLRGCAEGHAAGAPTRRRCRRAPRGGRRQRRPPRACPRLRLPPPPAALLAARERRGVSRAAPAPPLPRRRAPPPTRRRCERTHSQGQRAGVASTSRAPLVVVVKVAQADLAARARAPRLAREGSAPAAAP